MNKTMLRVTKGIITLFLVFGFYFLMDTPVSACWCSGSTKVCLIKAEGCFPTGCMGACIQDCFPEHCSYNDTLCPYSSPGHYYQDDDCCWPDEYSYTTCTCGCSGGACNPTCSAGWSSCSNGDTNSTDSYACGSRTYTNSCCGTSSGTCWCDCGCTPGAAPLCPAGTSETASSPSTPLYPVGVTDPHSNPQTCCDRDHGVSNENCSPDQNCNTRSCYCNICTPPTCSTLGYYSSAQFYSGVNQGKVPNSLTAQCRNGNTSTPNRSTLCSLTYRDCYCESCLKSCPNGLYNTAQTATPNLILSNFRECTNDCGVQPLESEDDCYEKESPQPVESFRKITSDVTANDYGFFSTTHTGDYVDLPRQGDLNDPLLPIRMEAKYTDSDGASDVEGMFVWFRGDRLDGQPYGTPVHIGSATPQASANDSWGFMLRRNAGDWVPYVPSFAGATPYWTTATLQPTMYYKTFFIAGTNQQQMVEVTILDEPVEVGDDVTMQFSLRFLDGSGNLYGGEVGEGLYNILLMGLDKFSFTPYDNYEDGWTFASYWTSDYLYYPNTTFSPYWQSNQLRYRDSPTPSQTYAKAWTDTNENWIIDRTYPTIGSFSFGTPQAVGNTLRVGWSVSDNRDIHSVIGNIYTTETALARQITLSMESSSHTVTFPSNPFMPHTVGFYPSGNTGRINGTWQFGVVNITSTTNSGILNIDIGENTVGSFELYLTVFDEAGNLTSHSIRINLADWFVSAGGLAYSSNGSYFSTKAGTFTSGIFPPYSATVNPGLQASNADSSSELWAVGSSGNPSSLLKSSSSRSYNVTRYEGNGLNESYYSILMKAYEKNKSNLQPGLTEVNLATDTLSGMVSPTLCSSNYCVLSREGDLSTLDSFVCNKQTLIFVEGNLTINPQLYSSSPDEIDPLTGCIFVVSGTVTITAGSDPNSLSFGYDKVHGYILSDGVITILDERPKSVVDGVYINGGISSSNELSGVSIVVDRYLRLVERLSYPVLTIDYHPKYGVMGGLFFGNDYVMQPVEVGIKP